MAHEFNEVHKHFLETRSELGTVSSSERGKSLFLLPSHDWYHDRKVEDLSVLG